MRIKPRIQDPEPSRSNQFQVIERGYSRWTFVVACGLLVAGAVPFSVNAVMLSSMLGFFADGATPEEAPVFTNSTNAQEMALLEAAFNSDPNPIKGGGDILVDGGALVPQLLGEDATERASGSNGEISVYVVRPGDTLSQIAEMYGVSANTILWANDISDAGVIQPGDSLVILPINGITHVVKEGDTISTIAEKYEGDVEEILSYNQIDSADSLSVGDSLVIPGGLAQSSPTFARAAATPVKSSGGGASSAGMVHPLPGSVKTQGLHGYNGVDLAAPVGTPIRAAAAGEVIVSKAGGYNGGYGSYVVIRHPNGTQTLYAHTSRNAVVVGERVVAGETIAYVGSTGRSTGPHLHFEVRGARNPF